MINSALIEKVLAYPNGTPIDVIYSDLTINNTTVYTDIQMSTLEGYLSLQGILAAAEGYLVQNPTPLSGQNIAWLACREFLRMVNSPHVNTIFTSDGPGGSAYPTVIAMLDSLLANPPGLINQTQYNYITGLMSSQKSWAYINCYDLTTGDIQSILGSYNGSNNATGTQS